MGKCVVEYSDGVGGVRVFVYGVEFEICNFFGNLYKFVDYDVLCDVCFFWN